MVVTWPSPAITSDLVTKVPRIRPDPVRGRSIPWRAGCFGSNWAGGSYDPETGIAYLFSRTEVHLLTLDPDPDRSGMYFVLASGRSVSVQGLPLVNPPGAESPWFWLICKA